MFKKHSELRQDLVSGDWIVMSPGRALRPHDFIKKRKPRKPSQIKSCPFEDPQASGHGEPILIYKKDNKEWELQIVPNKYPAVSHDGVEALLAKHGPYSVIPGVGHHDLLITRDHNASFPELIQSQARLVFQAFRDRYLMLLNDKYIAYVSIFHNWGTGAGASIYHPHYQLIAIPVIPPDVHHSLDGSSRYYKKNKACVHCAMISWELKERKRIIYENEGAVAFVPFVARDPFEVRVFSKKHLPYFENTLDEDMDCVVMALQASLKKIKKNLGDPDYNFFIHTAPIKDKRKYGHYHWHIEVLPKISVSAGFELGTGVEITALDPNGAAKLLRSK